jgi:hypothetical protein
MYDLLDRQERAGLAGADGDVAEHRGHDHHPRLAREQEECRSHHRQPGQQQQRGPGAEQLRGRTDCPRQSSTSYQGRGHEYADARGGKPQIGQIQRQQDS